MIRAFPAHFPDYDRLNAERLQRALLFQCAEALNPNDETLEVRRKGVERELIESVSPALLAGPGNIPDALREAYRNNLMSLQAEGLPVTHETSAFEFWDYIRFIENKYKPKPKGNAT